MRKRTPESARDSLFFVCIVVGIVSLVLNIPVFVRVFRERAKLKKLGLSSLSRSLWIESRRNRWISRARGILLVFIGIFSVITAAILILFAEFAPEPDLTLPLALVGLFYVVTGTLLLAARYLRNQRERIDLERIPVI
jgi:VIT1/CCC1 family predicted Fe2+/Mn2+ transporter